MDKKHCPPCQIHRAIQREILSHLPKDEAFLEYSFHKHIADIAWIDKSIIFEIQCSPISLFEVEKRINYYKRLKYTTVWILHEKCYNRNRVKREEFFLRTRGICYYTNMHPLGSGIIYDQYEIFTGEKRIFRSAPLPISIHQPKRSIHSRLYFSNDLIDRSSSDPKVPQNLQCKVGLIGRMVSVYDLIFQKVVRHFANNS